MIAPVGSIKKNHDMSGQVLDHYGIFPRAVLQLYQQIGGKGDVITLSICQMGGWRYFPIDLVSDRQIYFDDISLRYVGLTEVFLNDASDVIKLMIMLEKKRFAEATKMNSTSSRTNAQIELKWYRKKGDKMCIQRFIFIDMAGSERVEKAGLDSGPTWKNG